MHTKREACDNYHSPRLPSNRGEWAPGGPGTGVPAPFHGVRVEGLRPGKEYEFALAVQTELGQAPQPTPFGYY